MKHSKAEWRALSPGIFPILTGGSQYARPNMMANALGPFQNENTCFWQDRGNWQNRCNLCHHALKTLKYFAVAARRSIWKLVMASLKPSAITTLILVINAAAYTDVNKAESEEKTAFAINATGAGLVAKHAHANNCPVIHISTDYVFDGTASSPYSEDDSS